MEVWVFETCSWMETEDEILWVTLEVYMVDQRIPSMYLDVWILEVS